jgi:hypothetical protein
MKGIIQMNIETLVKLCKQYTVLGWAVQAQLGDVLSGDGMKDQNPNALKLIQDFLTSCASDDVSGAEELAEEIDEYLSEN